MERHVDALQRNRSSTSDELNRPWQLSSLFKERQYTVCQLLSASNRIQNVDRVFKMFVAIRGRVEIVKDLTQHVKISQLSMVRFGILVGDEGDRRLTLPAQTYCSPSTLKFTISNNARLLSEMLFTTLRRECSSKTKDRSTLGQFNRVKIHSHCPTRRGLTATIA
jgi:hypothetical protein